MANWRAVSIVGQAFIEIIPVSAGFSNLLESEIKAGVSKASSASKGAVASLASVGKVAALGLSTAFVGFSVASVKAAGNFQTAMTQLVTGAGESQKNLKMVSDGILQMAPQVGTTTTALAQGMYMIESAGYHGAAGLTVLKAAAEGAKVGNADLQTVANGLTTVLTDYHLPASQAAAVTSQLIETVASGKTHMQDLAGSLSTVLPVASAAHIAFSDIAGSMATMTGQGISAQEASNMLANTIRQLQSPSQSATALMSQFGISATTVSTQLGQRGVAGTLDGLVNTITSHMGPAGLILQNTFKQSQVAAADAQTELKAMPASLQVLAKAYLDNQVTQTSWRKDLKTLGPDQRELATQFASTVSASRGFNDSLKSGQPAALTLSKALGTMLGGATGLNTALALTGQNAATATANIANINKAGITGAKSVQGFALTQKDLNFQIDQAKAFIQVLAIKWGTMLIPVLMSGVKAIASIVGWFSKHKDVALALAGVIGGALSVAIGAFVVVKIAAMGKAIKDGITIIKDFGKQMIDTVTKVGKFMIANPWILAIAALALAAYLVITHWSEVSKWFEAFWKDTVRIFDGLWHDIEDGFLNPIVDAFHSTINTIIGAFDAIRAFFVKWWPVLLPIVMGVFLGPLGLLVGVIVDEIILHWRTLLAITETVFRAIGSAVSYVWGLIMDVVRSAIEFLSPFISGAWQAISDVTALIWDGIKLYFSVWWDLVKLIWTTAFDVLKAAITIAWDTIRDLTTVVWDALHAYFTIWWAILKGVVEVGWDLIKTLFEVALDLITGKWSAAWTAISAFFSFTWSTIQSTVSTVWGALTGFLSSAFGTFSSWWSQSWGAIGSALTGVWNGIEKSVQGLWSSVSGFFTSGIADVEKIVNDAFIGPLNAVLGVFGVKISPLAVAAGGGGGGGGSSSGMAPGGMKRAESGMIVNSPQVLVGEGRKGYPEVVIPTDPAYHGRATGLLGWAVNALGLSGRMRNSQMPGMASGGIWGSITGTVTGAASDVGGALSGAANAVGGAFTTALQYASSAVADPAIDAAVAGVDAALPSGWFGSIAKNVIATVAKTIKGWVGGGTGSKAAAGMLPTGDHLALIKDALGLSGVPDSKNNEAAVNIIVTHESGWNPNAINLSDSNAAAGHPSQGLMQTIPSTFAAWAIKGYNANIDDPLSNMVAGIRYAVSRYGSLGAVPGVVAVDKGGAYVGYDSGGWLMPGATNVWNGTGRPERVISPTGAGPSGGGITLAAGAVSVAVQLSGDTSSAAGVAQLVQQGVQQGVTMALSEVLDIVGAHNLTGVSGA